jgi:hypothetical protein
MTDESLISIRILPFSFLYNDSISAMPVGPEL